MIQGIKRIQANKLWRLKTIMNSFKWRKKNKIQMNNKSYLNKFKNRIFLNHNHNWNLNLFNWIRMNHLEYQMKPYWILMLSNKRMRTKNLKTLNKILFRHNFNNHHKMKNSINLRMSLIKSKLKIHKTKKRFFVWIMIKKV